ncbi:MAG: OmpA family protein [Betaproteobacteria bacterium]|nr:OmpA family protein [Betaproteobacteria bacterium]
MKLALFAASTLFLAACASTPARNIPKETFIVLPSADGKVGSVVVKSGSKEQVLDKAYAASRVETDGQVSGGTVAAAEVQRTFADTIAALPGKPASFLLFFVEGKDELTPSSNAEIKSVMAEIKRRPEPDVQIIGHTDSVGGESFNDKLSQSRAEKIRDQLVTLGISRDRIQVSSRGKREPLVLTAAGVAEAKNRRVEVSVR